MLGKPFYGRQFFTPDGDGGAGGGSAGGDGGGGDDPGDGQGSDDKPAAGAGAPKPKDGDGKPSGPSANQLIKDYAASRNVSVADLLKQMQDAEDVGKSEVQKLTNQLNKQKTASDARELKLRTANAKVMVTDAASKANAIDTAAIVALVRDRIEFDDDGEPTNVAEVIDAARTQHPALFRAAAGSGDGGKGGPTNEPVDISAAIRRATGRTNRQSS